jgi:hypothetical protein
MVRRLSPAAPWVLPNWDLGFLAREAQQQRCQKQAAGKTEYRMLDAKHSTTIARFRHSRNRGRRYAGFCWRDLRHLTTQTIYPESE